MLHRQRQIRVKLSQASDALVFSAAFWFAHWIRSLAFFEPLGHIFHFRSYLWLLAVILPGSPFFLDLEGFYDEENRGSYWRLAIRAIRSAMWVGIAVILVLFLRKADGARGVIALFVPLAGAGALIKEFAFDRWAAASGGGRLAPKRIILIAGGAVESGAHAPEVVSLPALENNRNLVVSARLNLHDTPPTALARCLHDTSANAVVIAPQAARFDQIEAAIQVCELEGVEVWLLADFFQTRLSRARADELNGHPTLVFRSAPETHWHAVVKDAMDIAGSFIGLVLALPLFLVIGAAVGLTSKGPVFFKQRRSGLNGRPFTMYKFRTMVANAEDLKSSVAARNEMTGPVFKLTGDPRVTGVGTILRRWSLDELPQLFNVLRGEMSLVGPRPLPVDEVARFDDAAHRRRLSVKPGLTCLWQISGRNDLRDFNEWVRLDLEYIDNWSLWLDCRILFRTIPAVLSAAGAR